MATSLLWEIFHLHLFDVYVLTVTRSQVRSASNHDLNDKLHSVYSPFRFYWIDVEIPSEKKKSKKCTTVMLRWKTGLTDTNSNMWNTLKVFAHTSSTNAMQWDMIHDGRPCLRVTKRGWSRLPETHYMTLPLLPYIVFFFSLVHTGS